MMISTSPLSSVSSISAAAKPTVETNVLVALGRWLTERRDLGCTRITLMQYVSETAHDLVDEWTIGQYDDAQALAQVLYSTGLREAGALGASLSYGAFAFAPDRPDHPRGRFLFVIDMPKSALASARGAGDERTEIIKLLMAHADTSARLSLGHSRGILDHYEKLFERANTQQERMLDRAEQRIAELEVREVEADATRRQLQAVSLERERELLKVHERHKSLRHGVDKLTEAALPVAAVFAQQMKRSQVAATSQAPPATASAPAGSLAAAAPAPSAPAPASPSGDRSIAEAIDRFFCSMAPDQVGKLAQMLGPEQRGLLSELHGLVQAQLSSPPGPTSPAAPPAAVASPPIAPSVATEASTNPPTPHAAPEPSTGLEEASAAPPAAPGAPLVEAAPSVEACGGAENEEAPVSRSNETAVSADVAPSLHEDLAKRAPPPANTNVSPPTPGDST